MDLIAYIHYFGDACHSSKLTLDLQEKAEHFFIGLALDLPNVADARDHLLNTVFPGYKNDFQLCGKNISPAFESLLEKQIKVKKVPTTHTEINLNKMIGYFMDAVDLYYQNQSQSLNAALPLCCNPSNQNNISSPPNQTEWCRYVSFEVFETKMLLFSGRQGRRSSPPTPKRRVIYDSAWIASFNRDPAQVKLRYLRVELGRKTRGDSIPLPVFLTPLASAPHNDSHPQAKNAFHVVQEMGLSSYLKRAVQADKANEGVVALKFCHDSNDKLYRPTFLDAIDHVAFRPGPMEGQTTAGYRHGWTRKCKNFSALRDHITVLPEKGRVELVMKNRPAILPSSQLKVDAILFFE